MIKVKDGYAKLIGTTYSGSADRVLLSNGGDKAVSDFAAASALGDYVTLATAQTISGIKTFSGGNVPVKLNSTGNEVGVQFLLSGAAKGWVGHTKTTGTYIYNYSSAKYIGVKDDGTPYYHNGAFRTLLHSGNYNSYALPLSGGTLTSSGLIPLIIKSTDTYSCIRFTSKNTDQVTFGIKEDGTLFVTNIGGWSNEYAIYHQGNLTKVSQLNNDAGYTTATGHTHDYLPLTGGTLQKNSASILTINNTNNTTSSGSQYSGVRFAWNGSTVSGIHGKNGSETLWRSNASFANAYEIFDTGNYTSWVPKKDGTGASGTWGISITGSAGSAVKASYIESQGRLTAISGTTKPTNNGLTIYEIYNNEYPTTYGNLLQVKGGSGSGELALGWTASDACGNIYYRSIRDNTNSWSAWKRLAFTSDIPTVTNYYWANVLISDQSNSSTSPTFANATTTGLLTVSTGGSHCGIKAGSTYINSINSDLILQNNGAIRFGTDSWDYDCWAGLKYVHSSKTISLGLADGTHFTANYAQSGGTMQFPGINKFLLNGVVHVNSGSPGQFDDGIRLYGSAKDSKWSNINFGCDPSATSGTHANQWMIGRNTSNNFIIGAGSNYANTQFEIDTSGNVDVKGSITGNTIYANKSGASNSGGVSLYYNSAPDSYGIMFRGTSYCGTHGGVTSDWATYFTMSDTTNRGWIFRRGSSNVASIAGTGAGSFTATGTDKYIAYPQGGQYTYSSGNITGAIKIKLPVSKSSTMMSMAITIYNYSTGTSTTYYVGGYNYSDGNWYNEFAYANRQGLSGYGNLPVRFGNDGSKDCIYIGETTTTWSYPNIVISNVLLGHSTQSFSSWATGWEISITTSLGNINKTVTNPAVNYSADTVDGVHLEWSGSQAASSTEWLAGWTADGTKLKAVKRADLSVNYASSAGNADKLEGIDSTGFLRQVTQNATFSSVANISTDLVPGIHRIHISGVEYSSILTGRDFNGSYWQLYFHPSRGYTQDIKYRATNCTTWKTLLDSNNWSSFITIPSVGNGTVTITQAGTEIGSFTMNQSGNTTIALTDNNTWRGITDKVDTTSSTTSASATAVKTAYDKAVSAYNLANGKTANTGTVTSVATGAGLTGGTITTSGTIKTNLKSETKSTLSAASMGTTSSRQYAVGLDKDGYLSVNIPWSDTNTNYYPTTFSWTAGSTAGPTGSLTGSGMSAVSFAAIPSASSAASGVVTTGAQTFAGSKTFNADTYINSTSKLYFNYSSSYTTNSNYVYGSSATYLALNGYTGMYFRIAGTSKLTLTSSALYPSTANANSTTGVSLGTSANRFTYGYFAASVYAYSGFYQSSDERLKTMVKPIEIDFSQLKKIPKTYFYWNSDPNNNLHIGTSAQQLQKYFPELISKCEKTGMLSVNYDKLGVIALAAIDKLNERIEVLEKENLEYRNKINRLMTLIDVLK